MRLRSAHSQIVSSSGGGRRLEQRLRTAVARRSGPVRISGDDRRRGELVEGLADRLPDLVADPGNRRLLVAERRAARPASSPGVAAAQPRQRRGPGGVDRLGLQQLARGSPSASTSARSAFALISRGRARTPKSGAPACAFTATVAQIGDVAAHRADAGRTAPRSAFGITALAAQLLDAPLARSSAARARRRARSSPRSCLRASENSNEMIHLSAWIARGSTHVWCQADA